MSHTQTKIISVPLIGTPIGIISYLKTGEKVVLFPIVQNIFTEKGIAVFNLFGERIGQLPSKSYRTEQIFELMNNKPMLARIDRIILPDNFIIISVNPNAIRRHKTILMALFILLQVAK